MPNNNLPLFVIKKNLQKSSQTGIFFDQVVTKSILADVCQKILGINKFNVLYVDNDYHDRFVPKGYNKGRLAVLYYGNDIHFISFSEKDIGGRNSSIQSVPTAFNMFYLTNATHKHLHYYFINQIGNAQTDYQILMYRLMKTIGFKFLNDDIALSQSIQAFLSIDDIMNYRRQTSQRNQSNNSTYITKSERRKYDIYGKTYGANKYETSLMCYALSKLAKAQQILTLYEVSEGDLIELPEIVRRIIVDMGNIQIIPTDMQLERREFTEHNSLRSPRYIFNLLEHLGEKHCAFCNCKIPEIIQGAHIWPVSQIKNIHSLSQDQKLEHAISGHNGLWLCENHHKMFDEGMISISSDGRLIYADNLPSSYIDFMDETTATTMLPPEVLTDQFRFYLSQRNISFAN